MLNIDDIKYIEGNVNTVMARIETLRAQGDLTEETADQIEGNLKSILLHSERLNNWIGSA